MGTEGELLLWLASYLARYEISLSQVGLVAISTSLIGWLIFVICFGNFNNGDNL